MERRVYRYSYLPCQLCVGKNHCGQCGEEIRAALAELPGVAGVEVEAAQRRLTLTLDGGDFEDVEDRAEALGVFL